ncbi:F-box protein [Cardamine amara subsp. amara]|uniref:F-box protein n=1 Tax=Cardamine amara subsp. amara TaxID=228776 RepID=A0ABD1AQY6_CARAN
MDRISNLPDEVLCHILSFFTTKEAALTSLLSKRWRNLFAFVPNLDIDDSIFLHPEEGKRERDGILQSFMDFVDRVLTLQSTYPIKKVSFKCKTGVDSSRVNHWICNVLQRGVTKLDLFVGLGDDYLLSSEIFISKTLVEIKIGSGVKLEEWDGEVSLPMLRTLVLDSVEFCFDKFKMLLCGCPVLEKLEMFHIEWEDWEETLLSASLKSLKIDSESCFERFSFDTPSLSFLDYSEFVAEDYALVNMENLVDARINLLVTEDQIKRAREPNNDLVEDDEEEEDVVLRFGNVKKLMSGIRNVKKLFLSPTTLEVLSLSCEAMPVFNNLKFLAILSHVDLGWQAMPVLLKNCPHLETLALWGLVHYVTDKCGDACDCVSREDKGRSLISSPVKKLHIKAFRGSIRELRMIKHFLYSFPCLEEMEIHAEENGPTKFEVPGIFDLVVELMVLYNELTSCDVRFMVCDSLYEKWTSQ